MNAAPISKTRASAIEAFGNVPGSSLENRNAKKWITFINAERDAVVRRCEFEKSVEEQLCNQKIKGAYAEEVFVGSLVIPPECAKYKESYDSQFRIVTVE